MHKYGKWQQFLQKREAKKIRNIFHHDICFKIKKNYTTKCRCRFIKYVSTSMSSEG